MCVFCLLLFLTIVHPIYFTISRCVAGAEPSVCGVEDGIVKMSGTLQYVLVLSKLLLPGVLTAHSQQ